MKQHIVLLAAALSGAAFAAAPVRDVSSGSLEERLGRLERILESRKHVQIEMQQQLSDLEYEVGQLRGEIDTHTHQLEQILARQRDLYQDIERRIATPVSNASAPAATSSGRTPMSSAEVTANVAYEAAFELAKNKRYDDAFAAFSEFISNYPQSSRVSNAYYWQGQLKFTKGDFASAKKLFITVISKFPKSPKRAESILKLGLIAEKEGQPAEAKKRFKQVVSLYPSTSAARLAKGKL